ncbi:MAG: hypothetical protein OEV64_11500 [Desulfobulbaceae bacterium]|nr:hypothetical protein [Desulfobulbaceae bacterium]
MLFNNIIELITSNISYAISLGILAAVWGLSLTTKSFYENIKKTLWIFTAAWLICFGYHVNTGRSIVYFVQHIGDKETPAEQGAFNKYYSHRSVKDEE